MGCTARLHFPFLFVKVSFWVRYIRLARCAGLVDTKIVQDAGLIGRGWLFGRRENFGENATKPPVAAPADLEPRKRLELGCGF